MLTVEFPHLLNLIRDVQFDTIYHEHFSYLSLHRRSSACSRAMACGSSMSRRLPTHGGSLRVFVCKAESATAERPGVAPWCGAKEQRAHLDCAEGYARLLRAGSKRVRQRARRLPRLGQAPAGAEVAAYGAAAKGNTLLNYCGVGSDRIAFVADRSPHKQGRYMPGSPSADPRARGHLRRKAGLSADPALEPARRDMDQLADIREWGGKFVTAIPSIQVS